MNKLIDILNWSTQYLNKKNVHLPRLNAEYIIGHVLKLDRLNVYLNYNRFLTKDEKGEIKKLLIMRGEQKIPLQYILGKEHFYGYVFKVNKNVLIPRPETEILVENCINLLNQIDNPKVLEIGVGSGIISLVIAKKVKNAFVIGVDNSSLALDVANDNLKTHGLDNVRFLLSDCFGKIDFYKFDMIISNPPYVSREEYNTLEPEVKQEPYQALVAENDGLFFYEYIAKEGVNYLNSDGYIAFEIGYNQADKVREILEKNLYINITFIKDYNGINRVVIAQKCGPITYK